MTVAPFTETKALIEGAERWARARAAYDAAVLDRWDTIAQAREDGISVSRIAEAFAVSRQSMDRTIRSRGAK